MAETPSDLNQPIVYVVDDDHSIRAALEDLIASVGLEARSFGSTQDFLMTKVADRPGCLVLDIRMPGQSGLDFQRQMGGLGIKLPVVFITGHGDITMSVRAMKDGAIEFLAKPFRDQDLLDAIQHGIAKDRLRRQEEAVAADLRQRWATLSHGEREVMALVAKGLLNKQIANVLDVSEITVKVRRARVMRKMQAKTLADLIRMTDRLQQGDSGLP